MKTFREGYYNQVQGCCIQRCAAGQRTSIVLGGSVSKEFVICKNDNFYP